MRSTGSQVVTDSARPRRGRRLSVSASWGTCGVDTAEWSGAYGNLTLGELHAELRAGEATLCRGEEGHALTRVAAYVEVELLLRGRVLVLTHLPEPDQPGCDRELAALEALVGGVDASHAPVQHAPAAAGAGGEQATTTEMTLATATVMSASCKQRRRVAMASQTQRVEENLRLTAPCCPMLMPRSLAVARPLIKALASILNKVVLPIFFLFVWPRSTLNKFIRIAAREGFT